MTSQKRKPTPRDIASSQKRNLIYKTTVDLSKQYGFNNITVKDIADQCGLSEGTIYHFFKTKDGILSGMRERIQETTASFIGITKDHLADPAETIYSYLLAQAAFFEDLGPELSSRYYMNIPVDDKSLRLPDQDKLAFRLIDLYQFIHQAMEEGTLRSTLTDKELSAFLLTTCNGLVSTWISFNGSYSLTETSKNILKPILQTFIQ